MLGDGTIAAIATALGGGIGVVRLSGPQALEIAARVVRPWPPEPGPVSHRMWRARAAGDEILCVVMRGPRSYTGEDVVELHGHGGALSLRCMLQAIVGVGARIAQPGEFTRRAFLNGRMDLARAEAVALAISAGSERALRSAQASLRGGVSRAVGELRGKVVRILAEVEAGIDFPEEDLDVEAGEALALRLRACASEVGALVRAGARGRLWAQGLRVALVGRPNVGKSSLFNALIEQERAVVDDAPGTTRDYIEATVEWEGIAITLIDTAGERETGDEVERRGVELGRQAAEGAAVVVRVVDACAPDWEGHGGDLIALNKVDCVERVPEVPTGVAIVCTSAVRRSGLEALRKRVLAAAGVEAGQSESEAVVGSVRQCEALEEARQALDRSAALLEAGQVGATELAAIEVRCGLERIGQVTGESVDDAVLDAIFAKFCIGK